MKKITAVLLALLMCVFVFASCEQKDGEDTSAPISNNGTDSGADQSGNSDYEYIKNKGQITIGITIYAPMNYYDENNELTGFDTEFAQLVFAELGLQPKFEVIDWNIKETELTGKTIDCIWNGMTISDELKENLSITLPYVQNKQVAVIKAARASEFTSIESMADAAIAAEGGSAGEKVVQEKFPDATLNSLTAQSDTLLEVKSGTSDIAIIDYVMAKEMVGKGTNYADLMIVENVEFGFEEYGIAFRKGSDMTAKVNDIIRSLVENGKLQALAEKYELALSDALVK